MSSKQSTADFIVEQLVDAGKISAKKMFGEYAVYCDGKVVALICDDQLFVKPTIEGKAFIGRFKEGPPYPGAKPHLLITGDRWEEREWLTQLIKITATQMPLPKKKAAKKSVGKNGKTRA